MRITLHYIPAHRWRNGQHGLMNFLRDQAAATKRRTIRKGTHSCVECRRRKIKCSYAVPSTPDVHGLPPTTVRCTACQRRGKPCISQWQSVALSDSDDVIAAAHMSPICDTTPTEPRDICLPEQVSTATSPSSFLAANRLEEARSLPLAEWLSPSESQTHASVREQLLRALPCATDIQVLEQRTSFISAYRYQSDYKHHNSWLDKTSRPESSTPSLLMPEQHPVLLARQMLLFAAALHDLWFEEHVEGLSEHHHIIIKRLTESAIKLVNLDDAFLGTLESLENLIFEIFHHMDCGNIRRGWITARRAVTAAQMLNLHRPGHHRYILINSDSDLDREVMWTTIVSMERLLSLLLGLPTSTGHMILACQTIGSDSTFGHNLASLVGGLAGKILERNQAESQQQALALTAQIDRDIIMAAEQMPSDFWRPLSFAGLARDSFQALMEARRAFGHICYYTLVVQLHLPHMLGPHNATQRVYSKIACVNASREILNREIELRTSNPITACCRINDILSLIAAMTLMLGHITSHYGNTWDDLLAHQRLGDRATVEKTLDSIIPSSAQSRDVLAVRCDALLRDLLSIEEDASRQRSRLADQSQGSKPDPAQRRDILIMRVPHLGSIRISQDGVATLSATNLEQAQGLSEGVTIGGIGSVLISQHETTDSNQEHSANNSSSGYASSAPPLQTQNEAHAPIFSTSAGPMFPAAIAGFDDWALQGVDTAFMENLLRGSAATLSDDGERWDMGTLS